MTQNCGFFSWTGAKEAFLNRNLLYRDEVVKKCIHDLASPCYSLVLTSPQTALTVAHARKEMVKLTLTGEDKVAHRIENVKAFFFLFVTILVCLSSLSCQPIVLLLVFEFFRVLENSVTLNRFLEKFLNWLKVDIWGKFETWQNKQWLFSLLLGRVHHVME